MLPDAISTLSQMKEKGEDEDEDEDEDDDDDRGPLVVSPKNFEKIMKYAEFPLTSRVVLMRTDISSTLSPSKGT